MIPQPIDALFAKPKTVLVAGAGGGFDVIAGLPIDPTTTRSEATLGELDVPVCMHERDVCLGAGYFNRVRRGL